MFSAQVEGVHFLGFLFTHLLAYFLTEQTACCYMFVEGNPAPTFKFYKGTQEIIEGGRYKLISDGDNNNMIMMAIAKVKSSDESEYRVYIENEHGSDEANFMLFVSGLYTHHRIGNFAKCNPA